MNTHVMGTEGRGLATRLGAIALLASLGLGHPARGQFVESGPAYMGFGTAHPTTPDSFLYRINQTLHRYEYEPAAQVRPNRVYLRGNLATDTWVFCTGGDRRPIVAGSRVQGFRIGWLEGQASKDWYEYRVEKGRKKWWKRVTDRKRPTVYRRASNGSDVISETAPDDWESWGGTLDPLPTPVPPSSGGPAETWAYGEARWYLTPSSETWDAGWAACAKLTVAGKKWRLPSVYELGWAFERMRMPEKNPIFGERASKLDGAWTKDEVEGTSGKQHYYIDFNRRNPEAGDLSLKLGIVCISAR